MIIGIPRETKVQEHRVAMVPAAVRELVKRGHRVLVERGAGGGASYPDEQYLAAGAEIVADAAAVFGGAEMIVKVKEPQPPEVAMLEERHLLFTYLHLAAGRALTESLVASGCTALAYETLKVNGRLPLLEPMSEIAGRMSAIVGSYHLAKHRGGRGVLLGGVPGVAPGRVVVLGGGTAGLNAGRVAQGIGADVTILEVDFERMRFLDIAMGGTHTVYSNETNLAELLRRVDLLIGAVLVVGAAAPRLVTPRNAAPDAPGQRIRGHRGRSGRLRRDHPPDDPRRPHLRRGGGDALLRGEHAGGLRPDRDPGPQQRHPAVDHADRRPRAGGGLPVPSGTARRGQCGRGEADLRAGRRGARPAR